MSPTPAWVLVTGDFVRHGGQDRANHELALYLAERGDAEVHLVAHRIDAALVAHPSVRAHEVPRPFGRHLLGEPLLRRTGREVARKVQAAHPGARVVVNGGNCPFPDVNWVHCVHKFWEPFAPEAPLAARLKGQVAKARARALERQALGQARVVIANSARTADEVRAVLKDEGRGAEVPVEVVYLGVDAASNQPPTEEERDRARVRFNPEWASPLVVFVGALGFDCNKGFDTLLGAWRKLCDQPRWGGQLVATGRGLLGHWRTKVEELGLSARVRIVELDEGISELLAAADVMVAPSRYEAYGLAVQEALCREVPVLVSARAGIAERYPGTLSDLLLRDVESPVAVADALSRWATSPARYRAEVARLGGQLRATSWGAMAEELVRRVEAVPAIR